MGRISQYLNDLKARTGYTQQQLSDVTGIPAGTLPRYFTDMDDDSANFEIVRKLVVAMCGSLDELAGIAPPAAKEGTTEPPPVQQPVHFSFQPLRDDVREIAREAICRVYESEAYKNIEKNVKSWKALALAETAFIILVLLWDITHPTMGFIQYTAISDPVTQGLIDWIRRA